MRFLFRLLINVVAILVIAYIVPGLIRVDGFLAALVAAILLGIVNTIIRPILVILTFPLTLLSFGLFLLRYQRTDALAGVRPDERFPGERLLGSPGWIHPDQHCELDPVEVLTGLMDVRHS